MRILVTGQRGFTGRYLVPALRARAHQVLPFQVDVTDRKGVEEAVAASVPDAVIHLAANAFVESDEMISFYLVNQLGTFNVLDAAARHAPGVPVLLASSATIYGNTKGGYLAEDATSCPVNHYGASKFAMEVGARLWSDRVQLIVARPFNYTGVGQEERYLLPKIVAHFRRREPVLELGNIDVARDFGDVRAVVQAYIALVEQAAVGTYNVCTGEVHSIREVVSLCEEITGHAIELQVNAKWVRANDLPSLGGDSSRLRAALPNWRPIALKDTLSWMLEQETGAGAE